MSKLLRVPHSLSVLVVLVTVLGSLNLFAAHGHKAVSRTHAGKGLLEPVDLSGDYEGRVYFGDESGNQYLMQGAAKLKIDDGGKRFTLTDEAGNQLRGQISTSVIPDEGNRSVGSIQLEGEKLFEIKWYRDKEHDILKLVRTRAANRVFRFCSTTLTRAQCKGRIQ